MALEFRFLLFLTVLVVNAPIMAAASDNRTNSVFFAEVVVSEQWCAITWPVWFKNYLIDNADADMTRDARAELDASMETRGLDAFCSEMIKMRTDLFSLTPHMDT